MAASEKPHPALAIIGFITFVVVWFEFADAYAGMGIMIGWMPGLIAGFFTTFITHFIYTIGRGSVGALMLIAVCVAIVWGTVSVVLERRAKGPDFIEKRPVTRDEKPIDVRDGPLVPVQ